MCARVCFCIRFCPSPYRPLPFFFLVRLPTSSALFPAICGLTLSRSLLCLPTTLHLLLTLHHSRSLSVPLISSAFPFFFVSKLMIFPDSLRWPFVSLGGNRVHRALLHSQFGSSLSRLVFTTGLREAASGHAVYLPPGHRWPYADIVIYL